MDVQSQATNTVADWNKISYMKQKPYSPPYTIKQGTSWNHLERVITTLNEMELPGTTFNEVEPSLTRWTQQGTDTKKQENHRKKNCVQQHCPKEYNIAKK